MDTELHPRDAAPLPYGDLTTPVQRIQMGSGVAEYVAYELERDPDAIRFHSTPDNYDNDLETHWFKNVPPEHAKAAAELRSQIAAAAKPLIDRVHRTGPIRSIINFSSNPNIQPPLPFGPSVHATFNVKNGIWRDHIVQADQIPIDPGRTNSPAGLALIIQSDELVGVGDLQEQIAKPSDNPWMQTDSQSNKNAEDRAERAERLMPNSGFDEQQKSSAIPLEAAALAAVAAVSGAPETFVAKQNRENREHFQKKNAEDSRRQKEDSDKHFFEETDANNAAATALARLEATFGLIHERRDEISRAPYASSELAGVDGEMGALKRFLASGRGSAALRARAARDLQRGGNLIAEMGRLGDERGAEIVGAQQGAAAKAVSQQQDQGAEAAQLQKQGADAAAQRQKESEAAAAIAIAETELAQVRANLARDRTGPQAAYDVAALREAENKLAALGAVGGIEGARAGADYALGEEELTDVMQPAPGNVVTAATVVGGGQPPVQLEQGQVVMKQQGGVPVEALKVAGEITANTATPAPVVGAPAVGEVVAGAGQPAQVIGAPAQAASIGVAQPVTIPAQPAAAVAAGQGQPQAAGVSAESFVELQAGVETPAGQLSQVNRAPAAAQELAEDREGQPRRAGASTELAVEAMASGGQTNVSPQPIQSSDQTQPSDIVRGQINAPAEGEGEGGAQQTGGLTSQNIVETAEIARASQNQAPSVVQDQLVDRVAGTVRDQNAQPVRDQRLAPAGDRNEQNQQLGPSAAGEAVAAGAANEPTRPSTVADEVALNAAATTDQTAASAPADQGTAPPVTDHDDVQPSERPQSHLMRDEIVAHAAGRVAQGMAQPARDLHDQPAAQTTAARRAPPSGDQSTLVEKAAAAAVLQDQAAREASQTVAARTQVDETLIEQKQADQVSPGQRQMQNVPPETQDQNVPQPAAQNEQTPPSTTVTPENQQRQPTEMPDKRGSDTVRHQVVGQTIKGVAAIPLAAVAVSQQPPPAGNQPQQPAAKTVDNQRTPLPPVPQKNQAAPARRQAAPGKAPPTQKTIPVKSAAAKPRRAASARTIRAEPFAPMKKGEVKRRLVAVPKHTASAKALPRRVRAAQPAQKRRTQPPQQVQRATGTAGKPPGRQPAALNPMGQKRRRYDSLPKPNRPGMPDMIKPEPE